MIVPMQGCGSILRVLLSGMVVMVMVVIMSVRRHGATGGRR
jgi:hypothetical protein